MVEKFYPKYFFESVETIPYSFFKENGITAVIFDMDNTLVNSKYVLTEKVKNWLLGLKNENIKICILSNTPRLSKVKKIGKEFDIPFLHKALKPWSFGFKKAINVLNEDKKNIAIIGDQIFTDVYGGNRFGIKTVLVKPIEKSEFVTTKMKRPFENYVLKRYRKDIKKEEV